MKLTDISLMASLKGTQWRVHLLAWWETDDDPSVEEDDWATGQSAQEAFAHAILKLDEIREGGATA